MWWRDAGRSERARDVVPALLQAQTALRADGADSTNEGLDRQSPLPSQLASERLCGSVPPLERAVAIGRNEHQGGHGGPRERLDDDRGGDPGEVTLASLLPRRHEPPGKVVVDDRSAGRSERESAPAAFRAPTDRPGAGGAAPFAERRGEPGERTAAAATE